MASIVLYLRGRFLQHRYQAPGYHPYDDSPARGRSENKLGFFSRSTPNLSAAVEPRPNFDSPTLGNSFSPSEPYNSPATPLAQQYPDDSHEYHHRYFSPADIYAPEYVYNALNDGFGIIGQEDMGDFHSTSEIVEIGPPPSLYKGKGFSTSRKMSTTSKGSHLPPRIEISVADDTYTDADGYSRCSMDIEIMYDPLPRPSQMRRKPVPGSPIEEIAESEVTSLRYDPYPGGLNISMPHLPSVASPHSGSPEIQSCHDQDDDLPPPPVPPKDREIYMEIRQAYKSASTGMSRI